MRKVFSVALMAAMVCLVGMTKDASATITISLVWGACGGGAGGCTATGSNTISVDSGGGQTLRLDIFLSHNETSGLVGHTFSLNFDNDLDLNLPMAPVEWSGTDGNPGPLADIYGPFTAGLGGTVESSGSTTGRINSYDSASVTTLLPNTGAAYSVGTFTATAPASYRVGQAFFTVNAGGIAFDGADVFSGSFNGLFDLSSNGLAQEFPPNPIIFGDATVNTIIPEPGTVSLLGLGLLGLVLAGRRSRS